MKIVIIGSGLIGLCTAHFLNKDGHSVTLIDRQDGSGLETSFANGALLTAGMAQPWNTPGSWRELLGSIGRSDAALQLRLRALPSLAGWGIAFLRNSEVEAFEINAASNLRLALYSLEVMASLRQETGIEYGRTARGSLKIFRSPTALARALTAAERGRRAGLRFRRLSAEQTVELEPALRPISHELAGAVHYQSDETGDAYDFCVGLTDYLRRRGVEFRFCTTVSSLKVRSGQVTAVLSDGEHLVADRYVVAAGSDSTAMLRGVGVKLPVRPAKGYSVTFDTPPQMPALGIPIIDDALHAAIVPLAHGLRVAGTAEFVGGDMTMNPDRVRNLVELLRRVLPQAPINPETAKPWCGLRALSADGVPIVGQTPLPNLWVNTGHGHLGWTMAAGSARLLADKMSDVSSSMDSVAYALERFT